jgi:gamma-glutamyltranspeptidase/glutathione hydrolase
VFGCPGGDVILQAMLQAFLNVVHFEMTPQQAVEAPRVASFSFPGSFYPFHEWPGRVDAESRIPRRVLSALEQRGHHINRWPAFEFDAGAVSMALDLSPPRAGERVLAAAADPRRICYALGR